MFPLARIETHKTLLIIAGHAAREYMLEWIAMQAQQGKVAVVDGGNHFNVYRIAKFIRRKTARLQETLRNIEVSRTFSCYQMAAALKNLKTTRSPFFILDFLYSFYDEDIPLKESQRLLTKTLQSIQQISLQTPMVISTRPQSYSPARAILLEELMDIASAIWEGEELDSIPAAARLALPLPLETNETRG